jgi:uncharacterized protein (TIGR03083 family)
MPLHPAAPEDLPGLVAAYGQTVQAVIDLGRSCSDRDFDKETAYPGLTVKDQIAHVAGLESWVSSGGIVLAEPRRPTREDQRKLAELAESAVKARRRMMGRKVVDELEGILVKRMAQLSDPGLTCETVLKSLPVPAPACQALRLRIMDIWTHEQDIRQALNRPGDLDAPGASVFVEVLFEALPRLVARAAGIEPGNVVIFDVTGPVVGRAGVRLEVGDDGRPLGTPLFTGHTHDHPEDEQTTSIILSTYALTRRAAGRGGLDDIHVTVQGDEDVARRVLEHLTLTP